MAHDTLFKIFLISLFAGYVDRKLALVDLGFQSTCLSTFAVQAVLYGLYVVFVWPRFFSTLRNVPKATGSHPIWGHMVTLVNTPLGIPHVRWLAEQTQRSNFIHITFAGSDRLVAASPRVATAVLHTPIQDLSQSEVMVEMIERGVGKTLLTANGGSHKELRKAFLPAFSRDSLRKIAPTLWQSALRLRDTILETHSESISGGASKPIDFWPLVHDGSVRLLLEAALNIDLDSDPMGRELLNSYHTLVPVGHDPSPLSTLIVLVQCFFLPQSWGIACNRRIRECYEARETIARIYRDLAAERIAQDKQRITNDLLDMMCEKEFNRNVENAVCQLNALIAAGHETTACATIWALFEIARNPDIQRRLREEVSTVISSSGLAGTDATRIDSLPFLHSYILEIYRLYPSVPLLHKETRRDIVLCEQAIPEGTQIHIPVYALNRAKDVWGPDAEELRPERWAKDATSASLKNLQTFAQGSRSCPGREFSTRVLKYFIAVLVTSFEFEAVPEEAAVFARSQISLRPLNGLRIFARPVQQ